VGVECSKMGGIVEARWEKKIV